MNIAIIPARGGSRRIPGKNIREFHGKPIIAYSIATARQSGLFERVFVSTDNNEIAEVAEACGAETLLRPRPMARDEVGTQAVMQDHLLNDLVLPGLTHACCIYATAPLMSVEDLKAGYQAIQPHAAAGFAYAFSVNVNPLFDAGQFYWGWANAFRTGAPLVSYYSRMVPVAAERVCDINTMDDWVRAERMYDELQLKEAA